VDGALADAPSGLDADGALADAPDDRPRPVEAARLAPQFQNLAPRGGDRVRHPIVCQQCGKEDTVPFKPTAGRPVLCRDCFSAGRR